MLAALTAAEITALEIGTDGDVWVGTRAQGLFTQSTIAPDSNRTNYPIGRPLLDRTIYAFIVDPTGVMA